MSAMPFLQSVVDIDERGRFRFPKPVWDQVLWLGDQSSATAILEEPGLVRLCPVTHWNTEIAPRIAALRAEAESDTSVEEELFQLLDGYKKIDVARRFTLSNEILAHLGILQSLPAHVFVEATLSTVRLLSLDYRNQRHRRALQQKLS